MTIHESMNRLEEAREEMRMAKVALMTAQRAPSEEVRYITMEAFRTHCDEALRALRHIRDTEP
jgi:hypothetical protein